MSFDDPLWIQSDGSTPVYSAREDRTLISAMWSEGVISGLRVKQRVAGAQMRVQVEDGSFVIKGDDSSSPDQNHYLGRWIDDAVDANMPVISAAPGSGSRRDLICVRINDPAHGGPAGRNATFVVVTGTPHATTPVLPAVPTSAIPMAEVLVPTGKTSILNSDITDLRSPARMVGEVSPGVIQAFAGPESAIDPGWAVCDGGTSNRLTDWRLFRKIGTTHGAGDGSTTFNRPDMRGRVPVGLDNIGGSDAGRLSVANTLGGSGGTETFTLVEANLPPHGHSMQAHTHTINHDHPDTQVLSAGTSWGTGAFGGTSTQLQATGSSGFSAPLTLDLPNFTGVSGGPSSASTGNGAGTSTAINKMPPYSLVNWIIKL